MSEQDSQVKIKFTTKEHDESLQVPDTALFAPVGLKRYGLSEIINYLLVQNQKREDSANPVPFDILINGAILTGSLQDYLTDHGMSNEVILELEYKRASLPPMWSASFENEDWIGSLDIYKQKDSAARILSGGYDGIVRVWNQSGEIEKQFSGHSGAIKSVKWISDTRVVSGGNDRQVRLWRMKKKYDGEIEEGRTVAILEGHKAPVSSIDVNIKENRILSGGYDNDIYVWSTNEKDMVPITFEHDQLANNLTSTAAKKRRKLAINDESIKRRSPLITLEGHKQPVEGVVFSKLDSSVGYSVSQDHTIKTWDLVTGRAVSSSTTGFSLLSVVELPTVNLLACGSSARHIMLHDPRVGTGSNKNIVAKQLVGHKNFVVSLAADTTNEYGLVSGSHDGSVKVWDVRSDRPVYTLSREKGLEGQIFAVDCEERVGVVYGGEDKKIEINK
ncbi:Ytm1 protein [Saccharomycopsis crataegensis]|uniref:Ribosome biogenesis protein YTM1 n=1 Tax=Saccharomycopsis crataegensis TaxID=43959 RepID=A0AAV5QM87_9ASCO|nr:Ytm1 protein [Saccharomycopsis crataegensis]